MNSSVSKAENLYPLHHHQNNTKVNGNHKGKHFKIDHSYAYKPNRESFDSSSYLKYSDAKNCENDNRRSRPHKRDHSRKKIYNDTELSSNDPREFPRKHHKKSHSTSNKMESNITESLSKSSSDFASSSLITQMMKETKFKQNDKDLLESLVVLNKTNVVDIPMTSASNTTKSPLEKDPIRKLPTSESIKDTINTRESYLKDIKYKNIEASTIFSPSTKKRPAKTMLKRPFVIKPRSSPISYGHRELYEFNKLLKVGEGSYGTVYKAIDLRSNQLVAMKQVKMEHEHEGFPLTAVREIKILRELNHKNIVNLREVISDQKDIYLVFEYMNHDLMGLLENKFIFFNESDIFSITKQILKGLEYCHSKNFLHRDMKCSNILLNNKGEVKLGDFGLSRFYNAAFPGRPYTNKVISLWYRPIELLLGEESYGFGIDIWSCGCILAQLFTRQPLFLANTEVELIDAITNLCGTPCTSDWPEVTNLPHFQTLALKSKRRKLLEVYRNLMPDLALQLLDQILMLNPMKRITASEALKSPWIKVHDQRPSSSLTRLSLPSWIDCHELQA